MGQTFTDSTWKAQIKLKPELRTNNTFSVIGEYCEARPYIDGDTEIKLFYVKDNTSNQNDPSATQDGSNNNQSNVNDEEVEKLKADLKAAKDELESVGIELADDLLPVCNVACLTV